MLHMCKGEGCVGTETNSALCRGRLFHPNLADAGSQGAIAPAAGAPTSSNPEGVTQGGGTAAGQDAVQGIFSRFFEGDSTFKSPANDNGIHPFGQDNRTHPFQASSNVVCLTCFVSGRNGFLLFSKACVLLRLLSYWQLWPFLCNTSLRRQQQIIIVDMKCQYATCQYTVCTALELSEIWTYTCRCQ